MIETKEIEYDVENKRFVGFLAYDSQQTTPSPGILIAHDWEGRHQGMCDIAIRLAKLGYVGFAVDMYGDAVTPDSKARRRAFMTPLVEDRHQITIRMNAAKDALQKQSMVDEKQIAAIGYCFGGLCALDLARSGADIKGAVSFHGRLTAPEKPSKAQIKCKLLVMHGYDDPLIPPEQITDFANEMTNKKADWQTHLYGKVQHSFTNPKAHDEEMGLFYNSTADKRSWNSLKDFLHEIFQ